MGIFSDHHGRMREAWKFDAETGLMCRPSVAAHKDGPRVVFGTKNGQVICLDQHGERLWAYSAQEELSTEEEFFVDKEKVHSFDHPPVIEDIDRDGEPEILAGSELGVLYCLSMEGKLLWKHEFEGGIRAAPAVADINMDGHTEILMATQDGKLSVLTSDGEVLFEYVTDDSLECTPGVMKSHGKTIIVFGTTTGKLLAVTPAQEVVWTLQLEGKITAPPAFFSVSEERRFVIGSHAGILYCVSENGEKVWEFKTAGSIMSKAVVADLDDDGRSEIVFGSCDNNVYAVTMDGKRMWSYETDFWVTDTPVVADINNDGVLEVVAGSYDHNVYVLDSRGEYMMDYVPGISGIVNQAGHYSNVLTSDPGEQAGKKLQGFTCDDIIVGCSLLEGKRPAVVVSMKDGHVKTLVSR